MKTVYDALTKKTYLITNNPGYIGCLMMTENHELVTPSSLPHLEILIDMGAKVVKEVTTKVMSPYVYPGLPMALFM